MSWLNFFALGTFGTLMPSTGMEERNPPTQPNLPSSPNENTTAMVHYYRAEMARMTSWRVRLDQTTNWAITVAAALLSLSLSTPTAHHGVLLFAMLLTTLLLYVEGRRYRFYDVYRMRVRQFERHYFARTFSFDATDDAKSPWLDALGQDLRHPRFRIDLATAVTRRLRRNYIWLYAILMLGWILKISSPGLVEGDTSGTSVSLTSMFQNAAVGVVPGEIVVALVVLAFLFLVFVALRGRRRSDDDEVHV